MMVQTEVGGMNVGVVHVRVPGSSVFDGGETEEGS